VEQFQLLALEIAPCVGYCEKNIERVGTSAQFQYSGKLLKNRTRFFNSLAGLSA
jgi:hypothetical protein